MKFIFGYSKSKTGYSFWGAAIKGLLIISEVVAPTTPPALIVHKFISIF